MLYFKVKIGFEKNDFLSIDEIDYPKAVKAQITGKVLMVKTGQTISGNNIISVLPDWIKMTGYDVNDRHEIDPDSRKLVTEKLNEYRVFIQKSKQQIGVENEIKKLT